MTVDPFTGEGGISVALVTLARIRMNDESLVSRCKKVPADLFDCFCMAQFRIGHETCTLVHCKGNVRSCGTSQVVQLSNYSAIIEMTIMGFACEVCMKDP
mgnify:CR=1 FL=1